MPFTALAPTARILAADAVLRPLRSSTLSLGFCHARGQAQTRRASTRQRQHGAIYSPASALGLGSGPTSTHPPQRHRRALHTTPCAHLPCAHVDALYAGNVEYVARMQATAPGLLERLARDGQRPPFMLVDCSDSRVNEQAIFSAPPGTIFTAGNIANRFDEADPNSNAVLAFAVAALRVRHVVVLGHYGCGGVGAAMLPASVSVAPPPVGGADDGSGGAGDAIGSPERRPADDAVQRWIKPIRALYEGSERPEIAAHRARIAALPTAEQEKALQGLPDLHCPAFRALVEENVKANVAKIARSAVVRDHYARASAPALGAPTPTPTSTPIEETDADKERSIYVHGWVYDVETGRVADLGVSVGPPGRAVPPSPFPSVTLGGC